VIAAPGGPNWLKRLDSSMAGWATHHGPLTVVVLVTVEVLIGLAALHPRSRTFAAAVGLVVALAIWVVGQDLGQLYSGRATDPNTAPLIALMAVAILARGRPTTPPHLAHAKSSAGARSPYLANSAMNSVEDIG
jgi:uncharacterized membrane protein YccC